MCHLEAERSRLHPAAAEGMCVCADSFSLHREEVCVCLKCKCESKSISDPKNLPHVN